LESLELKWMELDCVELERVESIGYMELRLRVESKYTKVMDTQYGVGFYH
jgi:hypothetical protein